jgi:SAM-dependent methyltransferase
MSYLAALGRAVVSNSDVRTLRLVCPACSYPLGEMFEPEPQENLSFVCRFCNNETHAVDGIWRAISPKRAAYFQEFMTNYQTIRAAEGRGSATSEFYLSLPYKDLTGSNQKQWSIRARTFRYLERKILPALEDGHSSLDILDLGAGNGWLSYRLALRGHRPVAVDLMTDSFDGLGAARHFSSVLPKLFPRFQAELDSLPFADCQFDAVMFNASFHYSQDYQQTLGEALRCLKSGGVMVIADTAWYSSEASGTRMIAERQAAFVARFGTASDAIPSLEFLTDQRLRALEEHFGLKWQVHAPFYGLGWAMRPLIARLRGKREPSTFRIYVAEVMK